MSVEYKSTNTSILKDISLHINSNEKIAILWPSGCGKTTLIHAISGILDKDAIVWWEVTKGNIKISVVFQTPCLLQWKNVYENIVFAFWNEKFEKQNVLELIRLVWLEWYEYHHPNELSLGMQQRVNFVRALAVHPDIILLDEPFSALDAETKKDVIRIFKWVLDMKKISCLLVTHNKDEAFEIADKIIHLTQKPTSIKEIVNIWKKDW